MTATISSWALGLLGSWSLDRGRPSWFLPKCSADSTRKGVTSSINSLFQNACRPPELWNMHFLPAACSTLCACRHFMQTRCPVMYIRFWSLNPCIRPRDTGRRRYNVLWTQNSASLARHRIFDLKQHTKELEMVKSTLWPQTTHQTAQNAEKHPSIQWIHSRMRDCLFCLRESKVLVLKFHSNHSRLAGPVGKALAFETKMLTFRVQVPLEPTNFCRSNLLFFCLGRTYFGHITVKWHEIYIFMQIDFGFEFEK